MKRRTCLLTEPYSDRTNAIPSRQCTKRDCKDLPLSGSLVPQTERPPDGRDLQTRHETSRKRVYGNGSIFQCNRLNQMFRGLWKKRATSPYHGLLAEERSGIHCPTFKKLILLSLSLVVIVVLGIVAVQGTVSGRRLKEALLNTPSIPSVCSKAFPSDVNVQCSVAEQILSLPPDRGLQVPPKRIIEFDFDQPTHRHATLQPESVLKDAPQSSKASSEFPAEWLEENDVSALEESQRQGNLWAIEVKKAMLHGWQGYAKSAWGWDEVTPVTNRPIHSYGLSLTLVDSLSTLWLMRLYDDFDIAAQWIEAEFIKLRGCKGAQSFFEITIRVLGGLLSAYMLSGRPGLLDVLRELGNRYLSIIEGHNLPPEKIDLCQGYGKWMKRGGVSIAEIGSFQLEFQGLALVLEDPRFITISNRASNVVVQSSYMQPQGFRYLPRSHMASSGAAFFSNAVTVGAHSDSYVEYMLKRWIQTGKTEPQWKALWHGAVDEVFAQLISTTLGKQRYTFVNLALNYKKGSPVNRLEFVKGTRTGLPRSLLPISWLYEVLAREREMVRQMPTNNKDTSRGNLRLPLTSDEWKDRSSNRFTPSEKKKMRELLKEAELRQKGGSRLQNVSEHLTCFFGGNLMLGARTIPNLDKELKRVWEFTAKEITRTCFAMSSITKTGLAPEVVSFNMAPGAKHEMYVDSDKDSVSLLRPEIVESLYYLHYYTGNPIYRHWGYKLFSAFQRHSITKNAYAAVENVNSQPVHKMDKLESFWFSETLKYFYLLFSPRSELNLDEWVLTTEAHPLRIVKEGLPAYLQSGPMYSNSTMARVAGPYM
eukprot:GHVQ01024700.1.p1 GENE.GHVQ01024700.1~~GHVQ01024700.1.p1  ORF type:complete len:818 (+),score=60.96 GHVQ01024700.1:419-2872(+)